MAQSSLLRRPAVMLVLALASVSLVVTLMGRLAGSSSSKEQKRIAMTGSSDSQSYPALSPDGKRIAYSAREGGRNAVWHIFVREAPSGTPKQLTRGEESDIAPVWSPDGGTLAFGRLGEESVQYIVIPADGGAERKLAEFSPPPQAANPQPGVGWTADGRSLVVVQTAQDKPAALASVNLSSGKVERLTNPPEGSEGDTTPVVSPAGDALAFFRGTTNEGGDIWVSEINGSNPRRVTFDDHLIRGIAWSRDGGELLYSADRMHGWHVWRVPAAGGSPRDVSIAGSSAYYPAIGRNRLAYTDSPTVSAIWRAQLGGDTEESERPLIRTAGRESSPAYSPDGSRIATLGGESDSVEIYLQDAEGGNRMQLTHMNRARMGRVRWSPDGKQLIFDAGSDHGQEVFVIGTQPGAEPRRVLVGANEASFSQNGKSIYYQSRGQIWKAAADGSNPHTLVEMMGASSPMESADGKYVIFRLHRSLWRVNVDAEDAEPEEFIVPDQDMFWTNIQPVKKGVYYLVWERSSRGMGVAFYDYAAKKSTIVAHSRGFERGGGLFSVSPDGKYILYSKVDRSQTNLMVVENFK